MTDHNGHNGDYAEEESAENQRILAMLFATLVAHGARPAAGCYIAAEDVPDMPPLPACVILVNARLTGAALAAASEHIVATLRTCADDLAANTELPAGCGVPTDWLADGDVA